MSLRYFFRFHRRKRRGLRFWRLVLLRFDRLIVERGCICLFLERVLFVWLLLFFLQVVLGLCRFFLGTLSYEFSMCLFSFFVVVNVGNAKDGYALG